MTKALELAMNPETNESYLWLERIQELEAELDHLVAVNKELVAVLNEMLDDIGRANSMPSAVKARAAIAKHGGA